MCIDLCEINGSFYLFWMDAVQLMYLVKGDTFVIKYRFLLFLKDRCTFTSLWHATLLISRADLYMKYMWIVFLSLWSQEHFSDRFTPENFFMGTRSKRFPPFNSVCFNSEHCQNGITVNLHRCNKLNW